MLHFVIGRSGSGKTRRIREEIEKEIRGGGRDVLVLVPEQQTVAWETRMAAVLPPSANLRMEITNFTRLANAVFREYGGLADELIDEGSRALLVWRAMLSVWDELEVYRAGDGANAGANAGTGREDRSLPRLMRAIDDLKAAGITPQRAEEALDELLRRDTDGEREEPDPGNGRGSRGGLASRLHDAVLVYAAYEELLHRDRVDRADLLSSLEKNLRTHPYFRGKAVFIDSFFSLTAPEERILRHVFAQADEVWVSFACPADGGEDEEPGAPEMQFGEVRTFLKSATRLAARENKPVERVMLRENRRHPEGSVLARVERDLYRFGVDMKGEFVSRETSAEVIRCADRYDEAEACASMIDRLLREGYACREIAVVARDMSTREGILDAVLRAHGIPCFLSESSALSHSPAVRLMLAALSVGAGGWQRRDIVRLLKTGLTPPTPADSPLADLSDDAFESYIAVWNIRGRRMFAAPDGWTMNPAGYQPEITGQGRVLLDAANEARARIIPPLERLLAVFDAGPAPVRDIAERLVLFAEEYEVEKGLSRLADTYRRIGMPREAMRAEQSWGAVCGILDKMVSVLGDTALDPGRFSGLFSRVAAALDVGTIPTAMDEVVLGSASGVRYDEAKCVLMLGTVDGEFPAAVTGESSFFDDRDMMTLESVGLVLRSPDSAMQNAREAFMFYRTAASASEKLFLFAPTGEGKSLSSAAERIGRLAPNRSYGEMPLSEIVYHKETAEYLLARRTAPRERDLLLRLAGDRASDTRVSLTAGGDRIAESMRESGPDMRLSQSRIETFLKCPFRYACQYRVRLAEEPRAEITPADVGNFVHCILERFFSEIPPERLPVPDDELRRTADGIIEEYVAGLARATGGGLLRGGSDGRLRWLFLRLSRHVTVFLRAVSDELAQSGFKPAAFELPIGIEQKGKTSVKPIRIPLPDGAEVSLDGIADRVDVWNAPDGKQYIRVVDYKTGEKSFSMDRVARGLDIQTLLYLFSVWKNGLPDGDEERERVPAGAVYLSLRPAPVVSEKMLTAGEAEREAEEKIERVGVYLADGDALSAMDSALDGRFVPVKAKEDGYAGLGKTALLTLDEFGGLYEQIEEVVGRIAREMRSGAAEARPRRTDGNDPCKWCAAKYVCRSAEREGSD